MTFPVTFYTDRSRMQAYRNCPRYRWLKYHANGTGLERVSVGLPLVTGSAIHLALADLLGGKSPQDSIDTAWIQFEQEVTSRGVRGHGISPAFLKEQRAMLEGLVWAWARVRLPRLRQEYEIVSIEHDMDWTLGRLNGFEIHDLVKCDALLRRRADGTLFYLEFKTTTTGGDEWIKQWEHNSQLLINTTAVEELLGERLGGVLIEGLLKGRRDKERIKTSPFRGQVIQHSPLCYAYKKGIDYSLEYVGPSWERIRVSDEMDAQAWTHTVMTEDECRALFVPVPPIRPRPELLVRHRAQMLHQEAMIASTIVREDLDLDRDFPQNDDHCYRYWGSPCDMEELCFNAAVAADPVGSGLYQSRTPHHELERMRAPHHHGAPEGDGKGNRGSNRHGGGLVPGSVAGDEVYRL